MTQTVTEAELERALEIDTIIFEEVMPILNDIDEKYPDESAYFTMFVNCLHVLFDEGWTMEELMKEVRDHSVIHSDEQGELH